MGTGDLKSHGSGSGLESKVKQAIADELRRQAETKPGSLQVTSDGNKLAVKGEIDLDDLAMVVIGSLAGGP